VAKRKATKEVTPNATSVTAARWYVPDVVKRLKVDEQTVRRWKRAGAPFETEASGQRRLWIEPARLQAWLDARDKVPGKMGRPSELAGASESAKDALAAAKLRKEIALATKAELDVAERKGELIPRAEVEAVTIQRIHAVKAALLGFAARVTPRVVGQDGASVHAIVDAEARGILEGFAQP